MAEIADTVFTLQEELGSDQLVEIGPGQGVLTKRIINEFEKVTLLEIDTILEPYLVPIIQGHDNAKIIR